MSNIERETRNRLGKLYRYELESILVDYGKEFSESFLREIKNVVEVDYIISCCKLSDDFARELGCIEEDTKWV